MLSGFLITGILLRCRGQDGGLKRFYIRRTLRIFPLYWGFWAVMLCLTGVLHLMWNRGNVLYLMYAGNYIWTFFGDRFTAPSDYVHLAFWGEGLHSHMFYVGHFWTLAVEEQFYLFWPLLILRPKRVQTVLWVCAAVLVTVYCAKVSVAFWSPGFPSQVVRITFLRCDEFAWGGLLAVLLHTGKATSLLKRANGILCIGSVALAASCVVNSYISAPLSSARWDFLVNLPVADLFAIGLILVGMRAGSAVARVLSIAPLVRLGRISYGFYVFHDILHLPLRALVDRQFQGDILRDAMTGIYAMVLTLTVSYLSFRYFETPFLKLKDRWPSPEPPRE